jgi:NOL1/NOP2/fmu family ribosome biogenesis protein
MSTALHTSAFAQHELSYTDALRYLRREAIILPIDAPRGFTLVTYRNTPLGFVKNLGNRANNLYPSEWRIRNSHLPDKEEAII